MKMKGYRSHRMQGQGLVEYALISATVVLIFFGGRRAFFDELAQAYAKRFVRIDQAQRLPGP